MESIIALAWNIIQHVCQVEVLRHVFELLGQQQNNLCIHYTLVAIAGRMHNRRVNLPPPALYLWFEHVKIKHCRTTVSWEKWLAMT